MIKKENLLKFEITENEDELTILLNNKKNNIGKLTLEKRDINYFNEYEIDGLINEQEERTLKQNEINHLNDLSERLQNKKVIYYFESLKINKEYRRQGYRTELMNFSIDYLKEQSKDMDNSRYINAYPSYEEDRISVEKLAKFYKKFGFKTMIKQKTNITLICEDIFDLKKVKLKKEKNLEVSKKLEEQSLSY